MGARDRAPDSLLDALRRQIEEPEHCYLETARGAPIRHSRFSCVRDEQIGQPVRFTRLAAESMLRDLATYGFRGIRMVPCGARVIPMSTRMEEWPMLLRP